MTVTAPAIAPATYRVDARRSSVRFVGRALFGLVEVAGSFPLRDGSVLVAEDVTLSRVHATLDATAIDTANRRRDADLRSKRFLDVARHPTITFSSRDVSTNAVTGVLTVRGVGQRVTLDLTPVPDADGCRFVATTRIDRRAFGVTAGRGLIAPELDVTIEVYASAM